MDSGSNWMVYDYRYITLLRTKVCTHKVSGAETRQSVRFQRAVSALSMLIMVLELYPSDFPCT